MVVVSPTLPEPVQVVVDGATRVARAVDSVVAIALVGSCARGTAGPGSDVDLVVLSDAPEALLEHQGWHRLLDPRPALVRSDDFGALQERRLLLSSGIVVEVGVGRTSWAATDPVDPGTHRVVREGFLIIHDPDGLLTRLVAAVAG